MNADTVNDHVEKAMSGTHPYLASIGTQSTHLFLKNFQYPNRKAFVVGV